MRVLFGWWSVFATFAVVVNLALLAAGAYIVLWMLQSFGVI